MEDYATEKKSSAHLEYAEKMAHGILSEFNPIDVAEYVQQIHMIVTKELSARAQAEAKTLEATQTALNSLNTMLDPQEPMQR